MNINRKDKLGKWQEFTLENDNGMKVSILNYGGIITEIIVPDRNENMENVVLGYKDYANYETNSNFFGALIGPVAGRIQDASFTVNNNKYVLEANDGKNHIHGGSTGFHQVIWNAEPFQTDNGIGLMLIHKRIDGTAGYPGNLDVCVTYTLNNDNQLILDYEAESDQQTPLTLTNHSYFNLSGDLKSTVHNHQIMIDSVRFIEMDEDLIPTGKVINTADTPFDFRKGLELRKGFKDDFEQNKLAGDGYDHYFMFDNQKGENVIVNDDVSGRILKIQTNQPGMVMYTANNLDKGLQLKEGLSKKYLGVCFETQAAPGSLHHDGFPSVILEPGESYQKQTLFDFGIKHYG